MVFKHFIYVFFTTSVVTPYSVVNNKAYATCGVLVLFRQETLAIENHKGYYVHSYAE